MFLPTGVALSKFDFMEASVIVLVDTEPGKVAPCFGLRGMPATEFTICFFYRLEGRNMLPSFYRMELFLRPLVFDVTVLPAALLPVAALC